ncbi:mycothiol-dependent nitroreductase Rv2466c family protein [Catellatospora paridis]|uniref:mycothiol-dependent nitroreductase Rv2466c family protein n=1 Tax=Catellatospora paridis TaxID=1617086 RepID=UPI0012D4067E|nr:disulfide bond formation protein DsbA [Catellatospora paridis]
MTMYTDMWFDPKCPWAWNNSRWLLEVERVRDVRVRFHVMSLWLLNRDREVDPWYREWLADTLGPVRVITAVQQKFGDEVVRGLYTALGTRIHHDKTPIGPDLYTAALSDLGLPADLAAAADVTDHDEALRQSHEDGLRPVGEDLGTPTIHIPARDGSVNAFFGPVVTPVPLGEAAGLLWDGVLLVSATPGFYEIKRGNRPRPRVS